jgi:hypothetical protein
LKVIYPTKSSQPSKPTGRAVSNPSLSDWLTTIKSRAPWLQDRQPTLDIWRSRMGSLGCGRTSGRIYDFVSSSKGPTHITPEGQSPVFTLNFDMVGNEYK